MNVLEIKNKKMEIKTPWIWKNGTMIERDNALEHNLTHTLHYGWWVFEWIRFYDTEKWVKIFRLKEHIDRLFYSAWVLDLKISYTKEEIMQACIETVAKSGEKSWYIRPIAYYGYGKMWLYPWTMPAEIAISVWKWWKYLSKEAVDVKIATIKRIHPATTDMNAKICWNYANSILVSLEIHKNWYDEWLLVDTEWYIAEGPGENIFFVKNKKEILTPKEWSILPWITRDSVIKIIKDKFWIIVKEKAIPPYKLNEFEEAFFVWTAAEVTPIASITDIHWVKNVYSSWEADSVSKKIQEFYQDVVTWKNSEYLDCLY